MNHYERVCAYVDLDAIKSNIQNLKNNINKKTKIIAVIKADGYGHGAIAIAKELEEVSCVHGYAVATAEEAYILRGAGIKKSIMTLGFTFPYAYEELIKQDIEITVFKDETITQLCEAAKRLSKSAMVHIKVDTAMSRLGIKPDEDGLRFVERILLSDEIVPMGIFSHFAKADSMDLSDADNQLIKYKSFLKKVSEIEKSTNKKIRKKHCSNSAAAIGLRKANMDLVRVGISLYGLMPSNEVKKDIVTLTPALTLKSRIIYIKEIEKGAQVSYGGTFTAPKKMKVATIPVGYGDGYPRTLSGKGHILIHGEKAGILGRVCMDQLIVDITDIPNVKEFDEVTLIGTSGKETITMEYLGDLSGRFNYELACDLSKRIPRVYIKDQKIIAAKDYYNDYEIEYF